MAIAIQPQKRATRTMPSPDSYHGIPILELHVGDPLPTPSVPTRYAVLVNPDLARYLLTFNHPQNRRLRERKVSMFASDMGNGRWRFTPESIVFSRTHLQNGQNRLMAVTEFGKPVWLVLDFGWDEDIITVIDRGSARTNTDTMRVTGKSNPTNLAAIVTKVWQYAKTQGTTRAWSGMPVPSSAEALAMADKDLARLERAVAAAQRTYRALDKGGSPTLFGMVYYSIAALHDDAIAEEFFAEVAKGTGEPGSATRVLADWMRRRPTSASKTGDVREPYEITIRAYNAWLVGKPFAFPKYKGFELSRLRNVSAKVAAA